MLQKTLQDAGFEQTEPTANIVQHPNFGGINFSKLDVKTAEWLVAHGYQGLKKTLETPTPKSVSSAVLVSDVSL